MPNDEPVEEEPTKVPFPPLESLSVETRAIVLMLGNLCMEIKTLREAWMAAPMQEINAIMLANMKAQMGGGIVPGSLVGFPGGKGH